MQIDRLTKIVSTTILGVSIIAACYVFMNGYKQRNNTENAIHVTGMGTKDFDSDLIVWRGSFSKMNFDLPAASAALDADKNNIKNYLVSKGVNESEIVFSAVDIQKQFDDVRNGNGDVVSSVFVGYILTQSVTIESQDVNRIEQISREVSELINTGVEFYSEAPEFYYTKLAELKQQMVKEATEDARMRAEKIAEASGSELGNLKNAEMGIFQIVGQNSNEDYSWGGTFNTGSRRKTASITMQLEFEID